MVSSLLSLLYLVGITQSQSLCANEQSYCITGLNINDNADIICAQYIYEGITNDCAYFKTINDIYLFHNSDRDTWDISINTEGTAGYYAYCEEDLLDDCIKGTWYYYDRVSLSIHPYLEITPCTYDNIECLNTYTINDAYCISNTDHREISENRAIRGKYTFQGCYMNQPYFVHDVVTNATLQWDDLLSVWHIWFGLSSAGGVTAAYCTKSNITECNRNWYIYDGNSRPLDPLVLSGFCNYNISTSAEPSLPPTMIPSYVKCSYLVPRVTSQRHI